MGTQPEGCWLWTAQHDRAGYAQFYLTSLRRSVGAHRFAYELLVGPIPDGLVIDHLCRNPGCVNPGHLEPVTNAENIRRGLAGRLKTHCPKGHPLDGSNVYLRRNGTRYCRRCRLDYMRGRPQWKALPENRGKLRRAA
jgi:hypothetical protein